MPWLHRKSEQKHLTWKHESLTSGGSIRHGRQGNCCCLLTPRAVRYDFIDDVRNQDNNIWFSHVSGFSTTGAVFTMLVYFSHSLMTDRILYLSPAGEVKNIYIISNVLHLCVWFDNQVLWGEGQWVILHTNLFVMEPEQGDKRRHWTNIFNVRVWLLLYCVSDFPCLRRKHRGEGSRGGHMAFLIIRLDLFVCFSFIRVNIQIQISSVTETFFLFYRFNLINT